LYDPPHQAKLKSRPLDKHTHGIYNNKGHIITQRLSKSTTSVMMATTNEQNKKKDSHVM
jgi:hypothetical protein